MGGVRGILGVCGPNPRKITERPLKLFCLFYYRQPREFQKLSSKEREARGRLSVGK